MGDDHTHLVVNQPYDETLSVYDDEEIASVYSPSPQIPTIPNDKLTKHLKKMGKSESEEEFKHNENADMNISPSKQQQLNEKQKQQLPNDVTGLPGGVNLMEASDDDDDNDNDDDDEDQSESSEEDEDNVSGTLEGAYDPAEYNHLPVNQEIKDLFQYITRYTPQSIDLENKLRPFIPEYIPAVGDIDAFLKVSRPDIKPERLGLQILDEPRAKQSDPTVLDLQLRSISKQSTIKQLVVRCIEEPDKNPKTIESWIESIRELHRNRPAQNVHYNKPMPDVEALMQEWPDEFEQMLKSVSLPTPELGTDLNDYVDMVCAILDIPIYKNKIESLHALFTLYSEFKNSQHFNQLARDNLLDNDLKTVEAGIAESINFE